jgi:hypothetical protein
MSLFDWFRTAIIICGVSPKHPGAPVHRKGGGTRENREIIHEKPFAPHAKLFVQRLNASIVAVLHVLQFVSREHQLRCVWLHSEEIREAARQTSTFSRGWQLFSCGVSQLVADLIIFSRTAIKSVRKIHAGYSVRIQKQSYLL